MKKCFLSLGILVFIIGCFATMPPPVKDIYLKDATPAEQKKMSMLEQDIIKINQENTKVKDSLKILKQKILVSEKDINRLEKEKSYLLEKEKLHTLANETDKLVQLNNEKKKNERQLTLEKLNFDYLNAKKDNDEVYSELKNAELAVKVAELNYEKAKIGRAFQDKTMKGINATAKDSKERDKNKINLEEYEKYYNDQKAKLENKQKEFTRYSDLLKTAENKLNDFKKSGE